MSEPADRKSRRQFLGMAGIGGAALLRLSGEEQGAAGSNIALNRAAYQSGSADDDHTAHLATDGSTATYWESKPHKEAWIAVDLGAPQSFDRIVLRWGDTYPARFRIQTSNDGLHPQNWQDVTGDIAGVRAQSIPLSTIKARHVRLSIPAAPETGERGYVLYGFEVYGSAELTETKKAAPFVFTGETLLLACGNWKVQNASFVEAASAAISRDDFSDQDWYRLPFQAPC